MSSVVQDQHVGSHVFNEPLVTLALLLYVSPDGIRECRFGSDVDIL